MFTLPIIQDADNARGSNNNDFWSVGVINNFYDNYTQQTLYLWVV